MILFFGLLRPYKGIDTLLEAFRELDGAELWIVGNPRMEVGPLRELAARARGSVRFVTRFVEDAEIPAIFRRADLVVLPYRDAEHSGVLYTGLAFGKPLVLSAVGGFPELATSGAARLVSPGDPTGLATTLASWSTTKAPASAWPPPPARRPPAPTPGTRRAPARSPSTRSCSRPAQTAASNLLLAGGDLIVVAFSSGSPLVRSPTRISDTRWRCAPCSLCAAADPAAAESR